VRPREVRISCRQVSSNSPASSGRARSPSTVENAFCKKIVAVSVQAAMVRNGQPWRPRGVDVFTVHDGKLTAKLAYVKG
jgi:ketosteroid isomerase-like protein